jgi:hypothetical protein
MNLAAIVVIHLGQCKHPSIRPTGAASVKLPVPAASRIRTGIDKTDEHAGLYRKMRRYEIDKAGADERHTFPVGPTFPCRVMNAVDVGEELLFKRCQRRNDT